MRAHTHSCIHIRKHFLIFPGTAICVHVSARACTCLPACTCWAELQAKAAELARKLPHIRDAQHLYKTSVQELQADPPGPCLACMRM